MISGQTLPLLAQKLASKSISDCSNSSLFSRIYRRLSLRKPTTASSPPLPPRALRAPSFRGIKVQQVFRYFDEDGDGKISASELCNCLKSVGEVLSVADAEEFLESSDAYGDGKLGYEEFWKLVEVEEEEERERTLREAFATFKMDGRGCITEKSLQLALRRLGEEKKGQECRDMIKRFDHNGDGVICFEEFKHMLLFGSTVAN